MEKYGNSKIVEMLSLSEEINSINHKVRQLVEDLHGTQGVLINLQELTDKLQTKVNKFGSSVNGYKPSKTPNDKNNAVPSHADGNEKPHRIVPTPENYRDYLPEDSVVPAPTPGVTTTKEKELAASGPKSNVKPPVKRKRKVKKPVKGGFGGLTNQPSNTTNE